MDDGELRYCPTVMTERDVILNFSRNYRTANRVAGTYCHSELVEEPTVLPNRTAQPYCRNVLSS